LKSTVVYHEEDKGSREATIKEKQVVDYKAHTQPTSRKTTDHATGLSPKKN